MMTYRSEAEQAEVEGALLGAPLRRPRIEFDPETHSYRVDGRPVPSVTQVIGSGRPAWVDEATWEAAAARGTRIHEAAAELELTGRRPETDAAYRGYLDGWLWWLRVAGVDPRPVLVEEPVASVVYRYAGTVDRVYALPGQARALVVDIKTGSPAVWHSWQVALYALALREMGCPVVECRVVYLAADGAARQTVVAGRDLHVAAAHGLAAVTEWHNTKGGSDE